MRGLHAIFMNAFAGQGLVHAAAAASGTVVPTAPGPGDVFNEGAQCTFSWTPDPSGTWKQTDVELMTGDNFNMVYITTVASFDGTDASKTSFSYPCPEVTPNAAIYFYQFSSPAVPDRQWTTRFAIADAQGKVSPPTNATQPNAPPGSTPIPWGTGALKDPSKAAAPPAYLGIAAPSGASGSASASASASASGSASDSASASASASASNSASASGSTTSATDSSSSSSVIATVTQTSTASGAPSAPAAPSSGTTGNNNTNNGSGNQNGAAGVRVRFGPAALALGVAAVGFAVAF